MKTAINTLRDWVNGKTLPNKHEPELAYYDLVVQEPVNICIVDEFSDWIVDKKSKKLYLNLIDRHDQKYIHRNPIRLNKVMNLFAPDFHNNLKTIAKTFDILSTSGFLNYGCLTRTMVLPIIPKVRGAQFNCLCYCFLFSDYKVERLNQIVDCELFSDEDMPLSFLTDKTIPDLNKVIENVNSEQMVHPAFANKRKIICA